MAQGRADAEMFRFTLDPEVQAIMATKEYSRMRAGLAALNSRDTRHAGYIYAPALDVAAVVLVAFVASANDASNAAEAAAAYAKTWAIVEALPQSGKTGVIQALWLAVSTPEFVEQYLHGIVDVGGAIFITGTNDNELRAQTGQRLTCTKQVTGLEPEMRVFHNTALQQLLSSWRKMDEAGRPRGRIWDMMRFRCMIIIDESHHGQNADSTVDQLLRELGISGDGDAGDNPRGHYVVSVSATPMTEVRVARHKLRVHLQPGKGYVGPVELQAQGRVLESSKLSCGAEIDAFFQLCLEVYAAQGFAQEGGAYVIVRVPTHGEAAVTFMQRMRTSGYGYIVYDAKSKNGGSGGAASTAIKGIVSEKPHGLNFVLVKRRLAQGVTFSTKHVALMYDTAASKTDTVAQSFLGRACGYRSAAEQRTLVYCDVVRAMEYITWAQSSFDPELTPAAARNMVVHVQQRNNKSKQAKKDKKKSKSKQEKPKRQRQNKGNAHGGMFEAFVPVLIRGAMTEEQLSTVREKHNWAIIQPILRECWPQVRHLTEEPYNARRASVRVARDVNKGNALMFEDMMGSAVAGTARLPYMHDKDGAYRYEVILDARTDSATRGDVVVLWRGAKLVEDSSDDDDDSDVDVSNNDMEVDEDIGIVTGISASEAQAMGIKQRANASVEMWARRVAVAQ